MHKSKLLILLLLTITIVFSGCSSKTVKVEDPLSTITSDESGSYIVFSYSLAKVIGAPEVLLYEIFPESNRQALLIDFDTYGNFVQKVTPGKHYYIERRAMPTLSLEEDFKFQFTVDTTQEKITYVDLDVVKVFTPQRKNLEDILQKMPCTLENLNLYNFKPIEDKKKSTVANEYLKSSKIEENPIKSYQSPLFNKIQISCKNNEVIEVSPGDSFFKHATLKSMKALPTIKPANQPDDSYLINEETIKSKYDNFHILHKDALQKYPFEIFSFPDKTDLHQYGSIQIDTNFSEKANQEDKLDINKQIN